MSQTAPATASPSASGSTIAAGAASVTVAATEWGSRIGGSDSGNSCRQQLLPRLLPFICGSSRMSWRWKEENAGGGEEAGGRRQEEEEEEVAGGRKFALL